MTGKREGRIDDDAFFNAKRSAWEIQRITGVTARNLDLAVQVFELADRAYDLMIS